MIEDPRWKPVQEAAHDLVRGMSPDDRERLWSLLTWEARQRAPKCITQPEGRQSMMVECGDLLADVAWGETSDRDEEGYPRAACAWCDAEDSETANGCPLCFDCIEVLERERPQEGRSRRR